MSKTIRTIAVLLALFLALGGLSACGGGGGLPDNAVAQVGGTTITKATLSQWMSTLAGGDFYELSHITPPDGLVSDPPNYAICIAGLKRLAPKLSSAETKSKCEQLYQALKQQAVSYLLTSQQNFGEDAEVGVKASEDEVKQQFEKVKSELFPTEADLQQYLAARNWTTPVELFLIKRNVLSSKLARKLQEKFSDERASIAYFHSARKKWTAKTDCRPGYVVEQCKQYKPGKTASTMLSPALLIKEIAAARPNTPERPPAPDFECANRGKGLSCHPSSHP